MSTRANAEPCNRFSGVRVVVDFGKTIFGKTHGGWGWRLDADGQNADMGVY